MKSNVGALVLAAGFSNRFGSLKLCAQLANGVSVIQQTLQQIQQAGLPAIVVTRPEISNAIALTNTRIETFDGAQQGMGATLAFGATLIGDWDGCLVCLADMPFIEGSTYLQIAECITASTIVIPSYHNRPGNPVGFGRDFFPQLKALRGDNGGRSITESNPDQVVELVVDDAAVLKDIDTPEDLSRLQQAD